MKNWGKKQTVFHFNVQKIRLRRRFDISKMKNYEKHEEKVVLCHVLL